jgi:putative nucleotidyltransferase with HDIG domain
MTEQEKILIIDDEPIICDILLEILTSSGYLVVTAPSGDEGYQRLLEESFDLVITDIKMPGMSGTSLIEKIRKEISTDLPIIVITAHGTLDVAIESMTHGTQGFVLKPFTPDEILGTVDDVITKDRIIKENIKLKALLPIFEVNKRLLSELNIEKLMDIIIEEASKYTGSEKTSLMLLEDDGTLRLKAYDDGGYPANPQIDLDIQFGERVVKEKSSLLLNIDDADNEVFRNLMEAGGIKSVLCVPIIVGGNLLGVLKLSKVRSLKPFSFSDMEVVSVLCGQAGIAIENAKLYEKGQETNLQVISVLASTVEARDSYTANHAFRLSNYSADIAKEMDISYEEIQTIKKAAILHDIGKIGIPDDILFKEAPLTDDEFNIMKKHPEIGTNILDNMKGLGEVALIVKHHHEFYDGTGYPSGLKADRIPVGARIVAIADAFEAMTSNRPYRANMPHTVAFAELERMAGIQFDPEIVNAFEKILKSKGMI